MVYDREEAAQNALAQRTNAPGMCQQITRGWFGVPSVGDFDGDGRADAEDGWKSEPVRYRHPGDRNPPRGVPVSFLGGSRDDGHRAASLGGGLIRSIDFDTTTKRYKAGTTGTGTIAEIERALGVTYAGWSETCDGVLIPLPAQPKPVPEPTAQPYVGKTRVARFLEGGPQYDLRLLREAAERRADARQALARIEAAAARLPRGQAPWTRVARFRRAYRTGMIRLGLLTAAVSAGGRTGVVREVRDVIRAAIEELSR